MSRKVIGKIRPHGPGLNRPQRILQSIGYILSGVDFLVGLYMALGGSLGGDSSTRAGAAAIGLGIVQLYSVRQNGRAIALGNHVQHAHELLECERAVFQAEHAAFERNRAAFERERAEWQAERERLISSAAQTIWDQLSKQMTPAASETPPRLRVVPPLPSTKTDER